jgi:flagellin-like hook-associated protein FlgL
MANGIVLSAAVRSNLLSLQQTASLLGTTQTRLATGKKVNSALDNPINFFTASSLNSRAGDLTKLLDGISNATKTLEAADNGLSSITKLVENLQAVTQQALSSAGTTAKVTGSVTGLTATTALTITAGKTVTVNDGTTTATFTADATPTVGEFLTAVNSTANLNVKASLSSDGRILLEATSTNTIVIGGDASAAEKLQLGLVDGTTAAGTLNTTRSTLASQFNTLRSQIDQLAKDAGFNGVNLLDGNGLKVVFNETGSSTLSISGVTYSATGLGISASANTFQTDFDINAAATQLTASLNTLRSQASTFGSNLSIVQNRQDFTKSMINTLQTGADNLVLADTNEEGANLLSLQTRQSLSTTTLSLAVQASQNVLRLFG